MQCWGLSLLGALCLLEMFASLVFFKGKCIGKQWFKTGIFTTLVSKLVRAALISLVNVKIFQHSCFIVIPISPVLFLQVDLSL